MKRRNALCIVAGVAWLQLASGPRTGAETGVLWMLRGEVSADQLGISLAAIDDIDGDGVRDFAAGAPHPPGSSNPNAIIIRSVVIGSGKDGKVLRRITREDPSDRFGETVAVLGDLDGDGFREVAVGTNRGDIFIHSPVDGSLIRTFNPTQDVPSDEPTVLIRLVDLGDVDGDGTPDLAYGDCKFQPPGHHVVTGRLSVYGGADAKPIWHRFGSWHFSGTGCSMIRFRDIDGDGLPEVASGEDVDPAGNGHIVILRGRTGEVLRSFGAELRVFGLGRQITLLGDIDSDSVEDLAVAGDFDVDSPWYGRGRVFVFSGATFQVLHSFDGLDSKSQSFDGDYLGLEMSSAGDMDGDLVPDLLLGTFRAAFAFSGRRLYGRVYLRSGRTGRLLASYEGKNEDGWFATALAPLGDANGDGRPEFLLGSGFLPDSPFGDEGHQEGEVRAVTFDASLPLYLRGDVNADGRVSLSDAIGILNYLFLDIGSGEPPCLQALDVDGSDSLNVTDPAALLGYIFRAGDAPSPPFPDCGRYGGLRTFRLSCERSTCAH